MKGFERHDPMLSLCGLNCGLCPMRLGGHCGGCGFGNQSCNLARCSLDHGKVEYCFQCGEYPCAKYAEIDAIDSFITHKNQKADMEKAQRIGLAAYRAEQEEKVELLNQLLTQYNAGRQKTLYCLAVNLLEAEAVKGAMAEVEADLKGEDLPPKERAARMGKRLKALAEERGVVLKLRKKKKTE